MEQNERMNNDRMDQPDNMRNEQNNESQNTSSGMRDDMQREQDSSGSGRSYDYGTEGSTEEDMNQDLGHNSNQQTLSNPTTTSTPGTGSDNMPAFGHSRAGRGSGITTKQTTTGSDFDGQNRTS